MLWGKQGVANILWKSGGLSSISTTGKGQRRSPHNIGPPANIGPQGLHHYHHQQQGEEMVIWRHWKIILTGCWRTGWHGLPTWQPLVLLCQSVPRSHKWWHDWCVLCCCSRWQSTWLCSCWQRSRTTCWSHLRWWHRYRSWKTCLVPHYVSQSGGGQRALIEVHFSTFPSCNIEWRFQNFWLCEFTGGLICSLSKNKEDGFIDWTLDSKT